MGGYAARILTPSIESRKATIHKMLSEAVDTWAKSDNTETVKGHRSLVC